MCSSDLNPLRNCERSTPAGLVCRPVTVLAELREVSANCLEHERADVLTGYLVRYNAASGRTIRTGGAPLYGKAPSLRTSMLSSAIQGRLCN